MKSLKSSLPYIRFLLFTLAIVYLSKVNKNFYNLFFKFTLFTLIFVIVDALIQFIFGVNLFNQSTYYLKDSYTLNMTSRISGIFGDELILGSYLSRITFILIGLYFFCAKKFNNLFLVFFLISIFMVVFLSGERLAFFIILFCILYIFFKSSLYRKKIVMILLILFSTIFLVISFNKEVKNRMIVSTFSFLDYDNPKPYSNKENFVIFSPDHHELYVAGYKMFLNKPILGHGHNMYEKNCENFKRSVSSCSTHPHNTLLQFAIENGIIGLLFLFAVYLYLIKLFFYKIKKSNNNEKNKFFLFKICLLSIITANFFPLVPSGNFFNNWLSILYYLPIGLYLSTTIGNYNTNE